MVHAHLPTIISFMSPLILWLAGLAAAAASHIWFLGSLLRTSSGTGTFGGLVFLQWARLHIDSFPSLLHLNLMLRCCVFSPTERAPHFTKALFEKEQNKTEPC